MFSTINIYKCEHCEKRKEMWEFRGKEIKPFKME